MNTKYYTLLIPATIATAYKLRLAPTDDHQLSSSIICLFPSGCEEATKELERYKVSEDTEMW